ncbi:MAG: TonB-dependent receptor plug domain-containing protein [Acidobacteriota bacterium]
MAIVIMQDGIGTGSLSSQSGDHGEPIDVNQLERIEVVRGPATLLYGSSAIGGVVNAGLPSRRAPTRQPRRTRLRHRHRRHHNGLAGSSAGFEFGVGNWQFWASGGGQRTGNYNTPVGEILNSQTRMEQTQGGLGYYGKKAFANFNYSFTDSLYGVPYDRTNPDAEIPQLQMRRNMYRGTFGLHDVGFIDEITAKINYSDYNHQEIVEQEVETQFFNKVFTYRVQFDQKKKGRSSGSFGFSGTHRDYEAIGEESLTPPTLQNNIALFTVQNIDFETGTRVQLGGPRRTQFLRSAWPGQTFLHRIFRLRRHQPANLERRRTRRQLHAFLSRASVGGVVQQRSATLETAPSKSATPT